MSSSRKRRPPSFDLTPPGDAEASSGWTYRSEAKIETSVVRSGETAGPAAAPAGRMEGALDWVTWPVKFVLVLLFAPFHGTRRKPQ